MQSSCSLRFWTETKEFGKGEFSAELPKYSLKFSVCLKISPSYDWQHNCPFLLKDKTKDFQTKTELVIDNAITFHMAKTTRVKYCIFLRHKILCFKCCTLEGCHQCKKTRGGILLYYHVFIISFLPGARSGIHSFLSLALFIHTRT